MVFENKIFDKEREFYESDGVTVISCRFEGAADGESAFKESKNICVRDCLWDLRYPFWHDENLHMENTLLNGNCRAALWYSKDISIKGSQLHGIKALRECKKASIEDSSIVSAEFGWMCDYKEVKGNMYCGIAVLNEASGEWVWKWDCGTETFTEKEKGEASDAFKRAGFRWGIGRELYTSPKIYLDVATVKDGNKWKLHNPRELYGIYVSDIETEEVNGKYKIKSVTLAQKVYGNAKRVGTYSNK